MGSSVVIQPAGVSGRAACSAAVAVDGITARMLDLAHGQWHDHWVNAQSGVVTAPGQIGSFEQGVGLFPSEYEEAGRPMHAIGIWDCIADGQCRWRQVRSTDGRKTWAHDWVMHWRRAG
jgi:hypothetical protein